jgi:hypothetical protein
LESKEEESQAAMRILRMRVTPMLGGLVLTHALLAMTRCMDWLRGHNLNIGAEAR